MSHGLEEVNRTIRALAERMDPADSSDWGFVCECGADGCNERIGLSLARYDALRTAARALLAPGHRPGDSPAG